MDLLIVMATTAEAEGLGFIAAGSDIGPGETVEFSIEGFNARLLITGPGQAATAYELGRHLVNNRYRLALNLGIAGSFRKVFAPGFCGLVMSDHFGDLGAEDQQGLLSIFELGLVQEDKFPFQQGLLHALFPSDWKLPDLQKVQGVTVNRAHGRSASIEEFIQKFPESEFESMEGAAFYLACRKSDQPCLQLRSVSNFVGPRDRSSWKISEALATLRLELHRWLAMNRSV